LDLQGDEPQGGLLARMLALPGLPSVALRLEGEGPLSAWQGNLDLALDGRQAVDLDLTAAGTDPRAIAFDGRIAAVDLLPVEVQPLLGSEATLSGRLEESDGSLRIERLRVVSDALALDLQGRLAA